MDTKKLRQKILDLAIHGKLVPQDPNDEPASVLLERIRAEKEQLIKEGKIKRSKKSAKTSDMPHYEQVPFEVPEGWVWTTVGELSDSILYGVSESAKTEGSYKLLRITDIQENTVDWELVPFAEFDDSKAKAYMLTDGDIVFARTGATVGKSYLVENAPANAIYASYLIRVKTSRYILPQYIKYFFESGFYWEQIDDNSVGVGQPNVNGTVLGNLTIPIPPTTEQQRIVDELKKWFHYLELIEKGQIALGECINSAKSKILDLAIHGKLVPQDPSDEPAIELLRRINPKFTPCDNGHYTQLPSGWCMATIKDVSNYGKCETVNVDDILDDAWILELEDIEKYSGKILSRLSKSSRAIKGCRHRFMADDVLYSKLRTYLNKVLVADTDGYCSTEIIPITPHKGILPAYLNLVLRSPYFLEYTQMCGYGVKMPRLSTSDAQKAIIPIPPFEEQGRIVAKVEETISNMDAMTENL